MTHSNTPLWTSRACTLGLTCAWSIIGFASVINALVKRNQDKDRLFQLTSQIRNNVVNIDDNDVFQSGAVIGAICIVLFVITAIFLVGLLIPRQPSFTTRPRIIAIQAGTLAFFSTWLFATLVPYTHFVRTRSARVTAIIAGRPVDPALVQSIQSQFGLTPVYRNHDYLRLVAILPWITLLFTILASVVTYMAASRSAPSSSVPPTSSGPQTREVDARPSEGDTTNEKVDEKVDDKVTTA